MPDINLPVQSGSDQVLKLMRRGYTVARYTALVEKIRATIPNVSLTTDIIVGHPGETREDFAQTLALCAAIRFDKVHIAAFSARPGTLAATQEADPALAVSEAEKEARRRELESAQEQIATEHSANMLGQTVQALVEGESKGKWRGRSPNNKLVFFPHPDDLTGQLVPVRITQTSPWSLQGQAV